MSQRDSAKGDRFFPYDAFLSHNQGDGSAELAQALEQRGVRVWHDGDADMSDQAVQEVIHEALVGSRFICVCVGPDFRNSKWVEAEYQSGLAIEKRFGVCRVMALKLGPDSQIPEALRHNPVVPAYQELDYVVTLLRAANARGEMGDDASSLPAELFVRLRADGHKLKMLGSTHTTVKIGRAEAYKLALSRNKHAKARGAHGSPIESMLDRKTLRSGEVVDYAIGRYEAAIATHAPEADIEECWRDLHQLNSQKAYDLARARYQDAVTSRADPTLIEHRFFEFSRYGGDEVFSIAYARFQTALADNEDANIIAERWSTLALCADPLNVLRVAEWVRDLQLHKNEGAAKRGIEQSLAIYEQLARNEGWCRIIGNENRVEVLFEPLAEILIAREYSDRAFATYTSILRTLRGVIHARILKVFEWYGRKMRLCKGRVLDSDRIRLQLTQKQREAKAALRPSD